MTISGILSGVAHPAGVGYALTRAATVLLPEGPYPVQRPVPAGARTRPETHPAGASAFDIVDTVELSWAARHSAIGAVGDSAAGKQQAANGELSQSVAVDPRVDRPHEQARLRELQRRDQEVRRHEQAHLSAAGTYALGGATYEYVTGPDGKRYAVSGEVEIDTAPIPDDPEATIRKMETVRAAALAPADPSAKDLEVAAKAARTIQAAQAEISRRSSTPPGQSDDTSGLQGGLRMSDADGVSQFLDLYG